ncbi:hypothetical protein P615_12915 [Brevibacillus laterosporus PE36]|nr:hypothetical protein P615_12915 [Brevibacillus laterosporus PE36]
MALSESIKRDTEVIQKHEENYLFEKNIQVIKEKTRQPLKISGSLVLILAVCYCCCNLFSVTNC